MTDGPEFRVGVDDSVPWKRHLTVLGVACIGLIIGIVLVLTGRESPSSAPATSNRTPSSTARPGPLLPSLGVVPDVKAARELLANLDPRTLQPDTPDQTTPSTSTSRTEENAALQADEAGVQRCQQAVAQQTTDRSLGRRQKAARLLVGRTNAFVLSYAIPASGSSPAGDRLLLVDVRTCRILGGVDH